MSISTIRTGNENPLAKFGIYVVGIVGVALVVYFGAEVISNFDNLKGKSVLNVESLYKEAEVFINDKSVGKTPFESKDIKSGNNKITLKAQERKYETTLNLPTWGNVAPLTAIKRDLGVSDMFSSGQEFWFEKDFSGGSLRIISEPAGAKVFIDNSEVGKTPYSTDSKSAGDYHIRVEHPGYESQEAAITLRKDKTLNATFKLFPLPYSSVIRNLPDSQTLYDLSNQNESVLADTLGWAKAVIYYNKTRGIQFEGAGVNKEPVFAYLFDYKGNIFDKEGNQISTKEDMGKIDTTGKGAYLGKISDGSGITKEAKEALTSLTGSAIATKTATIKETGLGWLRVRDTPGLNGTEVVKVNVGGIYEVLDEKPGWVKIKVSDTVQGWVSADYVTLSK